MTDPQRPLVSADPYDLVQGLLVIQVPQKTPRAVHTGLVKEVLPPRISAAATAVWLLMPFVAVAIGTLLR